MPERSNRVDAPTVRRIRHCMPQGLQREHVLFHTGNTHQPEVVLTTTRAAPSRSTLDISNDVLTLIARVFFGRVVGITRQMR